MSLINEGRELDYLDERGDADIAEERTRTYAPVGGRGVPVDGGGSRRGACIPQESQRTPFARCSGLSRDR